MSLQHHWSNAMHRLRMKRSRLDWHLTSCDTHTIQVYQSCSYYSYKPLVHSRKETHHWRELSNRWCWWRIRHGYNLGSCSFNGRTLIDLFLICSLWAKMQISSDYQDPHGLLIDRLQWLYCRCPCGGWLRRLGLWKQELRKRNQDEWMNEWMNQSINRSINQSTNQ